MQKLSIQQQLETLFFFRLQSCPCVFNIAQVTSRTKTGGRFIKSPRADISSR